MNRFQFYEKKVAAKLLLSKFVYPTSKKKIRLLKTTLAVLPQERDPEIASFGLASIYGRFPTFASTSSHAKMPQKEKNTILQRISLTATGSKSLVDLQLLVNKIIPFQMENKKYFSSLSNKYELNWSLMNCAPSNEVNYLFFKYPLLTNTYNLALQMKFTPIVLPEAIFYARIFQLPIEASKAPSI